MKRQIPKKFLLLISLSFVIGAFFGWHNVAYAFFSDTGFSQNTSFYAGTLKINSISNNDFSSQLIPGQEMIKSIKINNGGDIPFQYIVKTINASDSVCDFVNLKATLNGVKKYNGNLKNFLTIPITVSSQDNWVFTATLNSTNSDLENKTCHFNFDFKAWQTNFLNYGDGGFTDEKSIENTITAGSWTPTLSLIGNQSGTEGELLKFTVSATDPNGDPLTYSASNLPDGASFDSAAHTFNWIPAVGQNGTYTGIHFGVSNGTYSDSEDITITISEMPPPNISNITVTNITSTSAQINWQTDQLATSKVEYGKTDSYGPLEESSILIQSHQISLSGLMAEATYHYRVTSKNSANKETSSADAEFTTNPAS